MRRAASWADASAGIRASLLHYYFPTIDDLFVAVLHRRAGTGVERVEVALSSPEPLRAWWELAADPHGAGLFVELLAAANHRPRLRAEIGAIAREIRRVQVAALSSLLPEYGVDADVFTPLLVAATVQGLAFGGDAGSQCRLRHLARRSRRRCRGDDRSTRTSSRRPKGLTVNLAGRSAVVAGGAGGLGAATVRRLAAAGVAVVVLDPDVTRSELLVAEGDGRVAVVEGAAEDDAAVESAIAMAAGLGAFSVAVSATGVVIPSGPLVDRHGTMLSKETLLANLDLHVAGPFNLARFAAAAFTRNEPDGDGQRGVIVQTASISAFDGQTTMVPYAAAKGAVVSMTLPMARDLAPWGIRVCTICPGAFATPRLSSPQVQEMLVRDVTFPKRVGDPDEYAALVHAIVTNPYMNGEVIRLDGGARLKARMTR